MTHEGLYCLARGCVNLKKVWVNTATMNSTLTNREEQYKATETYKEFHALYPQVHFSPLYGVQYGEIAPHDPYVVDDDDDDDDGDGDDEEEEEEEEDDGGEVTEIEEIEE